MDAEFQAYYGDKWRALEAERDEARRERDEAQARIEQLEAALRYATVGEEYPRNRLEQLIQREAQTAPNPHDRLFWCTAIDRLDAALSASVSDVAPGSNSEAILCDTVTYRGQQVMLFHCERLPCPHVLTVMHHEDDYAARNGQLRRERDEAEARNQRLLRAYDLEVLELAEARERQNEQEEITLQYVRYLHKAEARIAQLEAAMTWIENQVAFVDPQDVVEECNRALSASPSREWVTVVDEPIAAVVRAAVALDDSEDAANPQATMLYVPLETWRRFGAAVSALLEKQPEWGGGE